MNPIATALNHALTQFPRVFSLHSADGRTAAVFVSPDPMAVAQTLQSWEAYYHDGYTAIDWLRGLPKQSFGKERH